MKPPIRISRTATLLLAAAATLACGGSDAASTPPIPDPHPAIASIVITTTGDTIVSLGDSVGLTAQAKDATGAVIPADFTWTSSAPGVISVASGSSATTTAVGVSNGSSTISARASSVSGTKTVVVAQRAASLTVTAASNDTLYSIGDTRTFSASLRDARGASMPATGVQWSVDKAAVATLNASSGASTTATVQGNGSAAVTARSGTVQSAATLNARQRVARLTVTPNSLSLQAGQTAQINTAVADARGNTVAGASAATYASSDATKARVSATGLVTAVATGTATITVSQRSVDGGVSASVPVTVGASFPTSANVLVENFAFNPGTIDIAVGGTVQWSFSSEALHNVTSTNNGPLHSPNLVSSTFSFTFPAAGRFDYLCTIHPFMTATVVVH